MIFTKSSTRERISFYQKRPSQSKYNFFFSATGFIWLAVRYNAAPSILIWSTLRYVTSLWGLTLSSAALQLISRAGLESNAFPCEGWYQVCDREISGAVICFSLKTSRLASLLNQNKILAYYLYMRRWQCKLQLCVDNGCGKKNKNK